LYSGVVIVDDINYDFRDVNAEHLVGALAVAVGVDEDIGSEIKDLDLARLGKTIDLLAKAHALTESIASSKTLAKFLPKISQGQPIADTSAFATYDEHGQMPQTEPSRWLNYSHVLPEPHRRDYSIQVEHKPSGSVQAHLRVQGLPMAVGNLFGKLSGDEFQIHATDIDATHRRPELIQALNDAAMAYAYHNGAKKISGGLQRPTQKAETPGVAHAPTPPQRQQGPAKPKFQTEKGPTLPKPVQPPGMAKPATVTKSMAVTKAEAEKKCRLCGVSQFRDEDFCGCVCFREMAKSVETARTGSGYMLRFGTDWDDEALTTLAEALGKLQ
jgi:hypothetical protein